MRVTERLLKAEPDLHFTLASFHKGVMKDTMVLGRRRGRKKNGEISSFAPLFLRYLALAMVALFFDALVRD